MAMDGSSYLDSALLASPKVKIATDVDMACPYGYSPMMGWSKHCKNCFRDQRDHVGGGRTRVVQLYDSLKRYKGQRSVHEKRSAVEAATTSRVKGLPKQRSAPTASDSEVKARSMCALRTEETTSHRPERPRSHLTGDGDVPAERPTKCASPSGARDSNSDRPMKHQSPLMREDGREESNGDNSNSREPDPIGELHHRGLVARRDRWRHLERRMKKHLEVAAELYRPQETDGGSQDSWCSSDEYRLRQMIRKQEWLSAPVTPSMRTPQASRSPSPGSSRRQSLVMSPGAMRGAVNNGNCAQYNSLPHNYVTSRVREIEERQKTMENEISRRNLIRGRSESRKSSAERNVKNGLVNSKLSVQTASRKDLEAILMRLREKTAEGRLNCRFVEEKKEETAEETQEEEEDGDSDQRLEDAAAVITHLQDELEDLRAKIRRLEESSFGGYAEETTLRVAEAVEKATKVMEERLKQSEEKCGDLAKDNSELRGELVNLQLEMQESRDHFLAAPKDAEWRRLRSELNAVSKSCRDTQLRLRRAQRRAMELQAILMHQQLTRVTKAFETP